MPETVNLTDSFDTLRQIFKFNNSDWGKLAFQLIFGKLIMDYRYIVNVKYQAIKRKQKNPLVYYEIGGLIEEFIRNREKDLKKKEFRDPRAGLSSPLKKTNVIQALADFMLQVSHINESKEVGQSMPFDWKRRTLNASIDFYRIFSQFKDLINEEVPWGIYFEFTQQKRFESLQKSKQKLIIEEIQKIRAQIGTGLKDKDIRIILRNILTRNEDITRHLIKRVIDETLKDRIFQDASGAGEELEEEEPEEPVEEKPEEPVEEKPEDKFLEPVEEIRSQPVEQVAKESIKNRTMILKEKDGKQRINLIISDEKNVLKNLDDWRSLKELVELLAVKELLDIRYLLMKLKFLEKKKLIISEYRDNKKVWKRV